MSSKNLNPTSTSLDKKFDASFAISVGKDGGIENHHSRSRPINDANGTGKYTISIQKLLKLKIIYM